MTPGSHHSPETRRRISEALRPQGLTDAEFIDYCVFRKAGYSKAEALAACRRQVAAVMGAG